MLQLHTKTTGNIDSAVARIQKNNLSRVIGQMALQQVVDTDSCVPFDYNRDTKVEWATKCLQDANGFDWQLFGSIEGIENPMTKQIEIWDGLGRLCMAQLSNVAKIPVVVHKQGSPGALFIKKQKLRNRTLNQEAFFVAAASTYIKDGTVQDKKTDTLLKRDLAALSKVGLRVEGGTDNFFPRGINVKHFPKVKVNALRRSLAIANDDTTVVKTARDWIYQSYPDSDYVGKELLEGATFLFAACPDAGKNGTYKALCDFLKSLNATAQDKLPFKKIGGNQHNDEARSVALGIVEMFKNSSFGQGHPSTVVREKWIREFKRPQAEDEQN